MAHLWIPPIDTTLIPDPNDISAIEPEIRYYHHGTNTQGSVTFSSNLHHSKLTSDMMAAWNNNSAAKKQDLIFITHGFSGHIETEWLREMKDEITKINPDAFIFIVGWGKGAKYSVRSKNLGYLQAVANTQVVGKYVGDFVTALKSELSQISYIWGIGHSLGAHIMGKAGRSCKLFDRITGLDPAGPAFYEPDSKILGLDVSDGKFVDVIHTDGRVKAFTSKPEAAQVGFEANIISGLGTIKRIGTMDFYPNMGYSQPFTSIPEYIGTGDHSYAYKLFTASIANPHKFITPFKIMNDPLNNKTPDGKLILMRNRNVEMGYHCAADRDEGSFYLETSRKPPFHKDISSFSIDLMEISPNKLEP